MVTNWTCGGIPWYIFLIYSLETVSKKYSKLSLRSTLLFFSRLLSFIVVSKRSISTHSSEVSTISTFSTYTSSDKMFTGIRNMTSGVAALLWRRRTSFLLLRYSGSGFHGCRQEYVYMYMSIWICYDVMNIGVLWTYYNILYLCMYYVSAM